MDGILTALTIIAALIAIFQFVTWLQNQRSSRAERRLLATLADEYEAKDAKENLEQLKRLVRAEQAALEVELPRQARLLYLQNRREVLRRSLAADYSELLTIEAQLAELGPLNKLKDALSEHVIRRIEVDLLPPYRLERRREAISRLLLVAVAVLLILPPILSPSRIVAVYLSILGNASVHSRSSVLENSILGGVVLGLLFSPMVGWVFSRLFRRRPSSRRVFELLVTGFSVLSFALSLGLYSANEYLLPSSPYLSSSPYFQPDENADDWFLPVGALMSLSVALFVALTVRHLLRAVERVWTWMRSANGLSQERDKPRV